MQYYKFLADTSIFNKYREFAKKAQEEQESIYAIIRPLDAIGLYRNNTEVLGVVFPKEKELNGNEWELLRYEGEDKKVCIPTNQFTDWKSILVKLKNTDSKLKKELFNLESFDYFAYVLTESGLFVETSAELNDLQGYKTESNEFKQACDTYKNRIK